MHIIFFLYLLRNNLVLPTMKNCLFFCAFLFMYSISGYGEENKRLPEVLDSISVKAKKYYFDYDILESFKSYNRLKKLSDSLNNHYGKSISNLYLGNIYKFMDQFDDAKASYETAKTSAILANDYYLVASTNHSLGIVSERQGYKDDAIDYLEKALESAFSLQLSKDKNYTREEKTMLSYKVLIMLADTYMSAGLLKKSKRVLERLNIVDDRNVDAYHKGHLFSLVGRYFMAENKIEEAIFQFEEGKRILENTNVNELKFRDLLLSKICKHLYEIYNAKKEPKKAFVYLQQYNNYSDSYYKAANGRREAVGRSKFFIENYKNEIQVANNEKLFQLQIAKKTKNINYIMSIAMFLLGALLVTIYINYVSKKKLANILKKRNKELELARNKALESSESKSRFISNVTHELRTPLYGVVGITSLLLEDNNLNVVDSKHLKSLKYSGDYLLRLVNKILEFSKIESNKIELKKIRVDLKQLLENITGSFDYKLTESDNKIVLNLDEKAPRYVSCDNIRLSQVLINLIGNSVKFTKSGFIYLNVIVKNITEESVDLRFEVQDTGTGIPKEKFDTIFEDFSQLSNARGQVNGTGLGLTITKRILELFNSKIEVESEFGVGSKFSFNVNFEISDKADHDIEVIENDPKAKDDYNILIVEDNKINQVITKNLLKNANYSCEVVGDGKKAVESAKNTNFDLILMDMNMPIMGGLESANIIRTFDKGIPILALTAADIEDYNTNEKYRVFDGLITKPFDNYEFFQLIEYNLREKQSH